MLDISKFVTVNEDGKAVIDTEAYKSAYDAELFFDTPLTVFNDYFGADAVVFSVIYNVLYEPDTTEAIDASELVELVEFSTKVAQEELTIELHAEDQAFDGISTNVAAADKTYSMIDEIIEKFNLRYAEAEVIIKDIMTMTLHTIIDPK